MLLQAASVSERRGILAVDRAVFEFLVVSEIFFSVDPVAFSLPNFPILAPWAFSPGYSDPGVLFLQSNRLLGPPVSHHQNRHYIFDINNL